MPPKPYRQRQHGSHFQAILAGPVERTEPAEVVFEVIGGNAPEPGDPGLESAVIGIDVLDVPRSAHALPGVQVQRFVLHAQFPGRCGHGCGAVRAQDGVAVDAGLERLAQAGFGNRVQEEVGRRAL